MKDSGADPIAEAEAYIAYGRLAQARAILEEAMRRDPTREDIRLKLAGLAAVSAMQPVPQSPSQVLSRIVLPLAAPSVTFFAGFALMGGVFVSGCRCAWPGRCSSWRASSGSTAS